MLKVIIMNGNYKWKIGLSKTLKNSLVMFAPAILAFLTNVPAEYGMVAGVLAYALKNYLANK